MNNKQYYSNKYKIFFPLTLPLFLSVFLCSCTQNTSSVGFEPNRFINDQRNVILGFDLRPDDEPIAALIINLTPTLQNEMRTIILPFETRNASSSPDIYSSWGSYQSTTVINYVTSQNTKGSYHIGFVPVFDSQPTNISTIDDLNGSLYLIKEGLNRLFIYKYPESDPKRNQWLQYTQGIANVNIDSIAILLPKGAEGREIGQTGFTSIPNQEFTIGDVKFYPANSVTAGNKTELQVRYEILPSNEQLVFAEFIGKLLTSSLLLPTIQFITIKPKNVNPRRRNILIGIFISIQVVLAIAFIVLSFWSWNGNVLKIVLDTIAGLVGCIVTGLITWYEKKSQSNPKPKRSTS